jgi:hypothetical protein
VRFTLRTSPSSLAHVEATADRSGICLTGLGIYQSLFCLYNSTRLALVIDTKYLTPDLELASFASYGNGLVELELALAIKDVLGVELGYALDGLRVGSGIKVNHLLIRVLERQDNWVCWESSELGMQFLDSN